MNDRFNQRFQSVYGGLVPQIARLVPFNDSEVTCILMIYYKYSLQNGPSARRITSSQFVNIVIGFQQLYDMDVVDRIVTLIAGGRKHVTPMEFVNYMTILMSRDMERKMEFAYMVMGMYTIHLFFFFNFSIRFTTKMAWVLIERSFHLRSRGFSSATTTRYSRCDW